MAIDKYQLIRKIAKVNVLRYIAIKLYSMFSTSNHTPYEKTIFENLDVESELKEINKNGYSIGIKLSPEILKEVLLFCKENEVCVDRNRNNKIKISMDEERNPDKGTVYSYINTYKNCEAVRKIAHDPKILEIAKKYLGCPPKFVGSQIWWSYPHLDDSGKQAHTPLYGYHYDIDDLKFLKVFFYLNDVDEDRGPHVIIGNTHKSKNFFEMKNRRLSDDVALEKYSDRIKIITGKAGEGFFEDTFCYHKGTHPNKRRLLLQFEYAINDYGHQHDDN